MTANSTFASSALLRVGRRAYFIWAAVLILVSLLLPGMIFAGAPAGWLMLFMARARDTGRRILTAPALVIVGVEMFAKDIARSLIPTIGKDPTGYLFLTLVVAHLGFAVFLGTRQSVPRMGAA